MRATLVAKLFGDLGELIRHNRALTQLAREDVIEVSDLGHQIVVFIHDLLALEGGQTTQLHVENCRGLQLIELEQRHQTGAGVFNSGRCANECDDFVEGVECLEITAQDVGALLGLS